VHRGSARDGQPERPGRDGQIFSLRPWTCWSSTQGHGSVPPASVTNGPRPLILVARVAGGCCQATRRRFGRSVETKRATRGPQRQVGSPRAPSRAPAVPRATPDSVQGATGRLVKPPANYAACHKSGGSHLSACAGHTGRRRPLQIWLRRRFDDGRASKARVTSPPRPPTGLRRLAAVALVAAAKPAEAVSPPTPEVTRRGQ